MAKIIINPIGGLANRMRSIASGISLARECGVDYSIIWHKNRELNAAYEDLFEPNPLISGHISYPSSLRYHLSYSVPRKKNLYISKVAMLKYGTVLSDANGSFFRLLARDDSDREVKEAVEQALERGEDCYCQSGVNFYHFSNDLYRELFRPNERVLTDAMNVVATMGKEPIGIHIRRTDNQESIKHSPDNLFINEIHRILARRPDCHFYLATDDEATKRKFVQLFGSAIHISDQQADRNTKGGIVHAATEMFVLSKMTAIIGSHFSSFSESAAMIGDIPLTQLYR